MVSAFEEGSRIRSRTPRLADETGLLELVRCSRRRDHEPWALLGDEWGLNARCRSRESQ